LSLEGRAGYVRFIAERQKGDYRYDLSVDLSEWGPEPPLTPLADGQVIDLGHRPVTVYPCPGHTAGSVTFLDDQTRILFLGDACNPNLGLGGGPPGTPEFTSVETTLRHLKRLHGMRDRYDAAYTGHYDHRPLGVPQGNDVMRDVITACEQIIAGTAEVVEKPWPFSTSRPRPTVTIGRSMVAFDPAGIHDPH
jgi:hydroxyacylglutathione hydrolase